VLPKRFGKYGLTLHPEKTKLVRFNRPRLASSGKGLDTQRGTPGSFDLLGFTHLWSRSRRGNWVVRRKTASSRFRRALKRIDDSCRQNYHLPIKEQCERLSQKLNGHYGYCGITGNSFAIAHFAWHVGRAWRRWLIRRSQRARMSWTGFNRLLQRYKLPPPRCVHSILAT